MRMPTLITDAPTKEIQDLVQSVESLSLETQMVLGPQLRALIKNEVKRQRFARLLHEALVHLRLEVKYLSFDCDATRVERDHYKQIVEQGI